jgi:hypothetical protein
MERDLEVVVDEFGRVKGEGIEGNKYKEYA